MQWNSVQPRRLTADLVVRIMTAYEGMYTSTKDSPTPTASSGTSCKNNGMHGTSSAASKEMTSIPSTVQYVQRTLLGSRFQRQFRLPRRQQRCRQQYRQRRYLQYQRETYRQQARHSVGVILRPDYPQPTVVGDSLRGKRSVRD